MATGCDFDRLGPSATAWPLLKDPAAAATLIPDVTARLNHMPSVLASRPSSQLRHLVVGPL